MTDTRQDILRSRAAEFADVALTNIHREFPIDLFLRMRRPGDFPYRPRDIHPAFYGCSDLHTAIQVHWTLVKLLRLVPDLVPAADIRAALAGHLTAAHLLTETSTFRDRDPGVRPYGWGWFLMLIHELATWADDQEAQQWAANATQLGDAVSTAFVTWLPKATYPVRHGVHSNGARGLSLALPYARWRAAAGDSALLDVVTATAHRWFGDDIDYPAGWEPSGADFLSPALSEAELMAALLPAEQFQAWYDRFLPEIPDALRNPAVITDDTDGQIAHLHGLNLSRAWCWQRIADALRPDDPRVPEMRAIADRLATPEFDAVGSEHYSVGHWLVCYAVLYLTG